jgi:hypothetical protein
MVEVIRSLHVKIFLWFCFVSILARTIVFVMAAIHFQSVERPWLTGAGALDSYGRNAVDSLPAWGRAGLARYLDDIETSSRVRATLLDP